LRIRACAARPATAKCGGVKPHKGRKPDCGFAEPSRPPAAYSYRLLNAVLSYTQFSYDIGFFVFIFFIHFQYFHTMSGIAFLF